MPEGVRFTAWLGLQEREALRATAKELCTSENYIIRLALRQFLGLDKYKPSSRLSHVTSDRL